MAGERRLLLLWDPELDGAFRRRLERAFAELNVNAADASAVDIDPDEPAPVRVALVAFATSAAPSHEADMIVLAGPGDFPARSDALRLEIADIENATRRWTAFRDQIGKRLGRASLAVAPEDLETQLDAATRRAEEAERALADMERQRNDALRLAKQHETMLVAERTRASHLESEANRLTDIAEMSTFAMASVPGSERASVERARIASRLARDAAARAAAAADAYPDALTWPKAGAAYSGETRNRQPHGYGVMTFRDGSKVSAIFRGAFDDGVRSGHGVASADGGHTWAGDWRGGEASGFGLLETPDGRRFEGEIVTSSDGALRPGAGHMWTTSAARASAVHTQAPPLLPSPPQAIEVKAAGS
jgi:hypothetical protein